MPQAEIDTILIQAMSDGRDTASGGKRTTVYYDGSCPLCTAEIKHYRSLEGSGALRFVDVSRDGAELGPGLPAKAAMGRFHVRRRDGALLSGARAFVEIWRALPGWRWAARIADLPGVTRLLEIGYRLFLPIRPWLSRAATRLGATPANRCGASD
jgi:predicted DCC family thiol-disulfide oxidoreductase YuxK